MLRVLNVVYPVFIFAMLVFTCAAQVVTCFSRTQVRTEVWDERWEMGQNLLHLLLFIYNFKNFLNDILFVFQSSV